MSASECGKTWPTGGRHLDHPEPGEAHVCVLNRGHPPFCCCWCGSENEGPTDDERYLSVPLDRQL